jgi:hypothetical protein
MIQISKFFSHWVATTIVATPNLRARVFLIRKFLTIAEELLKMGNFNGVFEIWSGLLMQPAYRMTESFEVRRGVAARGGRGRGKGGAEGNAEEGRGGRGEKEEGRRGREGYGGEMGEGRGGRRNKEGRRRREMKERWGKDKGKK